MGVQNKAQSQHSQCHKGNEHRVCRNQTLKVKGQHDEAKDAERKCAQPEGKAKGGDKEGSGSGEHNKKATEHKHVHKGFYYGRKFWADTADEVFKGCGVFPAGNVHYYIYKHTKENSGGCDSPKGAHSGKGEVFKNFSARGKACADDKANKYHT